MADAIAVVNAGSSSVKFSVFVERERSLARLIDGEVEELFTEPRFEARDAKGTRIGGRRWPAGTALGHEGALAHIAAFVREHLSDHALRAVGHRVVHGGLAYAAPVCVDRDVLADLERLNPLAPLHQPHNLAAIRTLLDSAPDLPQVACFDTAFHRTQPPIAQLYALPHEFAERGIRRYGFHGLSYESIAAALPHFDPHAAAGRTIVLHLGNGASACALHGGRSIATSMGFTALEGLPMGTRCGSLDPGAVLYMLDELGMDARAVEDLLYHRSGLLGVSGLSSDMRVLLASDDVRAKCAIDLFVCRIGREIGSLAAALGGVDAIVFTAGIGEHAAPVRQRVCRMSAWLGVEIDAIANSIDGPRISSGTSRVAVWVIPTDEELMIARHTLAQLRAGRAAHR
jgi:acetate kinase